jgi:hypothetical protein
MESKEHRRKSKRYPVRWKAAVVFDKTTGKPTLHTQTADLSTGGAAIHSTYDDLTGTSLTLLLAQPPKPGEAPRMLKVRAHVVSTSQRPHHGDYRHGLCFVRTADDGIDALEEVFKAEGPVAAAPAAPSPAAPAAASAPAAPALAAAGTEGVGGGTTSRLATLKAMAQAKLTEAPKADPMADVKLKIAEALERAYKYFKEFAEQLNVVKPPFNNRGYTIHGVPEFSGLAWESGYADLRQKEISKDKKEWEFISLYYKVSGNKQLKIVRDYPASEKVARALTENKFEYKSSEKRSAKGSLEQVTFFLPCEFNASLLMMANYETGKIILKMKNVEHFGTQDREISPAAVTEPALEELTGYILGETNRLGPLILQAG